MDRCYECRATNGDHLKSCSIVANRLDVQAEEVRHNKYTGLLWIDKNDNSTNFKFNVAGGDFSHARKILIRFRNVIQERLDNASKCPYYE